MIFNNIFTYQLSVAESVTRSF